MILCLTYSCEDRARGSRLAYVFYLECGPTTSTQAVPYYPVVCVGTQVTFSTQVSLRLDRSWSSAYSAPMPARALSGLCVPSVWAKKLSVTVPRCSCPSHYAPCLASGFSMEHLPYWIQRRIADDGQNPSDCPNGGFRDIARSVTEQPHVLPHPWHAPRYSNVRVVGIVMGYDPNAGNAVAAPSYGGSWWRGVSRVCALPKPKGSLAARLGKLSNTITDRSPGIVLEPI